MGVHICRGRLSLVVAIAGYLGLAAFPTISAMATTMMSSGSSYGNQSQTAKRQKSAYDFSLPGPNGKGVPVSNFEGKIILLVNLARKSSYANQLPALIKLNDTYHDKGLIVLGIPSNDFGASEPGTEDEIQKYYSDAKVDFPVMALSKLVGDDQILLYLYLTRSEDAPGGGPVHWNFSKFILDKNGKVIARLDPAVAPDSPEMISTIEEILAGTYKPNKTKSAGSDRKDLPQE